MLKKVKDKVREFEERGTGLLRLEEDHLALVQLLNMFDKGVFLPLTSWSISPREVLHICNDLVLNNRKNIVEFGSGFSTICIARLLKVTGKQCVFYSIEGDETWAMELKNILSSMELSEFVTIITAPLKPLPIAYSLDDANAIWYDTDVISAQLPKSMEVDLIIVDGPQKRTCSYARYPAIPFLKDRLSSEFSIFLDDNYRPEEQSIVGHWKNILNISCKNYKRYAYFNSSGGFVTDPYGFKIL